MARTKLEKFKIIAERNNVIEEGKPFFTSLKGNWAKEFFKNNNDIVIEVGCGKGDYTIGMASLFPDKNFVGIDIKGSRLWKGSSIAEERGLNNAAFLRNVIQNLEENFDQNELSEVWITFPDPRPKQGDEKRRLTSARFINIYENLIKSGGIIKFKTDDTKLFDYTIELLQSRNVVNLEFTYDLYSSNLQHHTLNIQTTYEKQFLKEGLKIKYLQYQVVK